MPKQSFALEPGEKERLQVSWREFWKDVTISLDGNLLGSIPDHKALLSGQEFRLPDASMLKIQLVHKAIGNELHILRNGQPLPGSASDPQPKLKSAYEIIYSVAGFSVLVGLISFLFHPKELLEYGFGIHSIVFGLAFIALGSLVQRRSSPALFLAIITLLIDGLVCLYFATSQGYGRGDSGIMYRLIFLMRMWPGFRAIKATNVKNA